jgi:hypothetical protein
MDARLLRCAVLAAAVGSLGASYRTKNFVISAPSAQIAEQIGQAAEKYRSELAKQWLGHEMPNWSQPCPITAQVADRLGAGGATSFVFDHGEVFGWRMTIQGSLVRILDSVLPHEVTHTVFATHFRQPLPRWADEGACTTVEHASERGKQQAMLIDFLRTGRGIAFSQMFAMKEYPHDVMPLYSQGYSVARYLVAQGGKRKFLEYLADGLRDENWTRATQHHYGVSSLAALQNQWLAWVRQGSPAMDAANDQPALVAVKAPGPSERRPRVDAVAGGPRSAAEARGKARPTSATKDEASSVYQLAATARGALAVAAAAGDEGWHAPGRMESSNDAAEARDVAAADPDSQPAAQYQVTRPQPFEQARQVILEWSRPNRGAQAGGASAGPGGYPAPSAN